MLDRLLGTLYMPHGYCLLWDPWLVALHAVSDLATFGAYFAIPLAMWIFVRQRPNLELKRLALFFAAFILWCGLTHLLGLITLWWPVYEIQGIVKGVTAAISVVTAIMIFPLIPKALALPSPHELQAANARLQAEVDAHRLTLTELQAARESLEVRVAERTQALADARNRVQAIFEHAPVAMIQVEANGTVGQVNTAAELLFEAPRESLVGKPIETFVPEEQRGGHMDYRSTFATAARLRPMGMGRELFAVRPDGTRMAVEIGLNPLPGNGNQVVASIVSIEERRKQALRTQLIMRELSHRSKNLLAVIQGMTRQVMRTSGNFDEFDQGFTRRLQGLARSHDLLVGKEWIGATLEDLVRAHVGTVAALDGIRIEGPAVLLSADATQTLGLALHELATNALKYGALLHSGRLEITWGFIENGAKLEFLWRESGFQAQRARRGFGGVVLERVVPHTFGGTASLEISNDGLLWRLMAPLEALQKGPVAIAA